jgi:rhodanese-related sulfurtransferase
LPEEISPQELKARLDRGDRPVLLDVRQKWETEICTLEGAVNIPIEEIEQRGVELDPDAEIVVYCHHGIRSAAVAHYLAGRGFGKLKNLTGGIAYWGATVDPTMSRY